MKKFLMLLAVASMLVVAATGCKKKETPGSVIDKAADAAAQTVDDAKKAAE